MYEILMRERYAFHFIEVDFSLEAHRRHDPGKGSKSANVDWMCTSLICLSLSTCYGVIVGWKLPATHRTSQQDDPNTGLTSNRH